jgi:SAM-dependent methyltransferase
VTASTFAVLGTRAEIAAAERELRSRGLVQPPGRARRALRALRGVARLPDRGAELEPDPLKSWDVLRTLEAITAGVERDARVLDVGSVACPILPALHRLGYRRLFGLDLDERVQLMPFSDEIEYAVGDLTRTAWPDGSFAAITAISVIEHGVPEEQMLREVARLLRPQGVFLFSTDYWPDKIDTSGTTLFGLPWRIFSASEIEALLGRADRHGLRPVGEPGPALRQTGERTIDFAGRRYTFLHGALVKHR